jgi:hypothetical protein
MHTITCEAPTLRMRLPACAKPITSATLARADHPLITLELPDPAPDIPGEVALAGVPTDAPRGVYTLSLKSDCGCYETLVYLNVCPPPAFVPTHTPTGTTQTSTECCEPDTQPSWDTLPVVAAFSVTRSDPDTYVLTVLPPAPTGLTLSYQPLVDTLTITVPDPPADPQPVSLIDSSGVVIATGSTPTLTLPFDLRCTSYWLSIGEAPAP